MGWILVTGMVKSMKFVRFDTSVKCGKNIETTRKMVNLMGLRDVSVYRDDVSNLTDFRFIKPLEFLHPYTLFPRPRKGYKGIITQATLWY